MISHKKVQEMEWTDQQTQQKTSKLLTNAQEEAANQ